MKVLFIGGLEPRTMPNHRAHHLIAFLDRLDIQLDIISLTPFYTGKWPASFLTRFRRGVRESVNIPVTVTKRKAGIEVSVRKIPDRLDAFIQCLWAYLHLGSLRVKKYDLCIFGNPDNVLLPLLLKKKGKVETIIYDDWDFYPGFYESWVKNRLTKYREYLCILVADVVISVSKLLADLRKRQGAVRSIVIPNGVDYLSFSAAQVKRPHPPTLVYMGRLDTDWGLDVSIEGFAVVRKEIPTARFIIIGYNEGRYIGYLHTVLDRFGLRESIVFLGPKKYQQLPYYLAEADIGVSLHKPNDLMRYAFPLKVIEYMAAGLPVVATGIGETGNIISESKGGICVPYSSEAFGHAVLDIMKDSAKLMSLGKHAKEYAKRYEWNNLFLQLTEIIPSLQFRQGS